MNRESVKTVAGFRSPRIFRLFSFNSNHRQMIIRSDPEPNAETRIELYFGNVEYLAMAPLLRGIDVRPALIGERDIIREKYRIDRDLEYAFMLSDADPASFVISGSPSWREASRAFDDPSLFDFSQSWPPGSDMRWGNVE